MKCRNCGSSKLVSIINLGASPASNAYLKPNDLLKSEQFTPLEVLICEDCKLAQTRDYFASDDLFTSDYAYLSSSSTAWLDHCSNYCEMITEKLNLRKDDLICEVASNDGYLLTNFVEKNLRFFGIEPTKAAAEIAIKKGIETEILFLSEKVAANIADKRGKCDLIIGNNVFAHVPNIIDFTKGLQRLLKKDGTITLEFPHILSLLKHNQFDTIYHEHFSYHSLISCIDIVDRAGLQIYDVEELSTHGGSLRVYLQNKNGLHRISPSVDALLEKEVDYGLDKTETYLKLRENALLIRNTLRATIIDIKKCGGKIIAYGAAAKGNTLLNFCGITNQDIDYVFDKSVLKIGKYTPGSRIPILGADSITDVESTHVLILPWNIKDEVMDQLISNGVTNKQIITAIPEVKIESID
jgi:SAM-dependent methyltransferase